jgi:GTP cyclohydrolase I
VAKMFVQEIFSGLDPKNKPKISVYENSYNNEKMLLEANISFNSTCEHHFLPIIGHAHIGYVSSGKVIGLSKLNRIVDYYARRPQVQERMIMQIFNELKSVLETENVMIVIEASHLCVSSRGIKDASSYTSTIQYGGIFNEKENRNDLSPKSRKLVVNSTDMTFPSLCRSWASYWFDPFRTVFRICGAIRRWSSGSKS